MTSGRSSVSDRHVSRLLRLVRQAGSLCVSSALNARLTPRRASEERWLCFRSRPCSSETKNYCTSSSTSRRLSDNRNSRILRNSWRRRSDGKIDEYQQSVPQFAAGFSITVVPTLERAFDLDTYTIWLFLSKDHELLTECRKA